MKRIRKAMMVMLTLLLIIAQIACSNNTKAVGKQEGIVIPKSNEGEPSLTIVLNPYDYDAFFMSEYYLDYVSKFERNYGVAIKYEKIGDIHNGVIEPEDHDEYIKKLSTKLYAKDGLELIFSYMWAIEPLIKQGAAVKLNEKVPNAKNIYFGLLEDENYFAPISIQYRPIMINLEALKTTGLKAPELDWTTKEGFDIRTKWLGANQVYFNSYEWEVMFHHIVKLDEAYDPANNKLALDTPIIKQRIKDFRSYILNGNYIINKSYTFENYYRMIYEADSPEGKEDFRLWQINNESGLIDGAPFLNLLKPADVEVENEINGTMALPKFSDTEVMLEAYGFAVNKNGKNLELAYEFINGLLSDEIQLSIYQNDKLKFYPVIETIEKDIKAIEAEIVEDQRVIDAKEYVLDQLKTKKFKLWNTANLDFTYLKRMIQRDLTPIILADTEYTEAELSTELQKLEDKYNIWLNE